MPELMVKIGGDGTGYARAINEAAKLGQSFAKSVSKDAESVAGKIGAVFSGIGVGVAAKSILDSAGHFADLSAQTGISTDKLQQWATAAQQAGSDATGVAGAFTKMGVNANKAIQDPAGEAAKAFEGLGVSIEELKTQPLEDTFEQIAEYVRTTKVDAALIGNVVGTLGKGGATMIPVFKQGLDSGGLYRNEPDIAALDEVGDALTRTMARFKKAGTETLGWLARTIVNPLKDTLIPKSFSELGGGGKKTLSPEEKRAMALNSEANAPATPEEVASSEKAAVALAKKNAEVREKSLEKVSQLQRQASEQRRKNEEAEMTDAEKNNALLEERALLMQNLANSQNFSQEDLAQKALRIEQIDSELIQSRKKSGKDGIQGIQSDAATKIGAFIGGAGPSLSANLYARETLTATQEVARNTEGLVAAVESLKQKSDDGSLV